MPGIHAVSVGARSRHGARHVREHQEQCRRVGAARALQMRHGNLSRPLCGISKLSSPDHPMDNEADRVSHAHGLDVHKLQSLILADVASKWMCNIHVVLGGRHLVVSSGGSVHDTA